MDCEKVAQLSIVFGPREHGPIGNNREHHQPLFWDKDSHETMWYNIL